MTGFANIGGIMPATPSVPGVRFLNEDPVTSGYQSADRFIRGQQRDAMSLESDQFRLTELRRKMEEAQGLDKMMREAYAPQPAAAPAPTGDSMGGGFGDQALKPTAGTATAWDAPGTDPAMNAKIRQAMQNPAIGGLATGSVNDMVSETNVMNADADDTTIKGVRSQGVGGSDLPNLLRAASDPRRQKLMELGANTPGAGSMMMKAGEQEISEKDRLAMTALEYAAKGQPELADAIFRQLGSNSNMRALIGNPDAAKKAWDVLRTVAGQDPAYVANVMKAHLRGVPLGEAMEQAGSPTSWREDVARQRLSMTGGGTGGRPGQPGKMPADLQKVQWLIDKGVAPDAATAWQMVQTGKSNPQSLFRSVFSSLANQKDARGNPVYDSAAAEAEAMRIAQSFASAPQPGMAPPPAMAAPPVAPPSAPVTTPNPVAPAPAAPAPMAAPTAPQPYSFPGDTPIGMPSGAPMDPRHRDPLGIR